MNICKGRDCDNVVPNGEENFCSLYCATKQLIEHERELNVDDVDFIEETAEIEDFDPLEEDPVENAYWDWYDLEEAAATGN